MTKPQHMRQIQERFRRNVFYFVDDSVKNLKQLDIEVNKEEKILSLLFAAWGYAGPQDVQIAKTLGFPVFQQEDLISFLKKKKSRD